MSIPIYLSGAPKAELWAERPDLFGALLTPQMGNVIPDGIIWAADNGCFNPKVSARFNADQYIAWLASRPNRESCLFASAPDVVGDARATLERSLPVMPRIRAAGFRAAFVGQDGLGFLPIPWNEFDVLFVGGTTSWKLGKAAERLCCEARARGKWIHVGRVNSEKRLKLCAERLEADSVDGTFVAFAPTENVKRLQGWYGCPDCRELVRPDEFGLHEGCPALAGFKDNWDLDWIRKQLKKLEAKASKRITPINTGDRLEELR